MIPAVRRSVASQVKVEDNHLNLGDLYRTHGVTVARWVAHLGGPGLEVDDLVHDVFLIVQKKLPSFREEAKVTTWLYRITEHVVKNARRRQRFRRWVGRVRGSDVADCLAMPVRAPGADMEQEQEIHLVHRVLDQLPGRYRVPLVLFELEGLSGSEIAELTGVRVSTVWVQIHRGRALFLDALKQLGVHSHVD